MYTYIYVYTDTVSSAVAVQLSKVPLSNLRWTWPSTPIMPSNMRHGRISARLFPGKASTFSQSTMQYNQSHRKPLHEMS